MANQITIHPGGDKTACTKFYRYLSHSCEDISLEKHECLPLGNATEKVRASQKWFRFIPMTVTTMMAINPGVVEVLKSGSGSKW